jgi:RNA polymerase sigma-70 factor (ECF subfamily)
VDHGNCSLREIDRVRDASRFAALSLDDEMPIEGYGGTAISTAAADNLRDRFEARAPRELKGLSVARATSNCLIWYESK